MEEYTEKTYGERIAGKYDLWYSEVDLAAIQFLSELAHGGPALELGIGTGRFALPLLQAGVNIQGLDVSDSMVAYLRAKPGGDRIPVTMANFADVPVEGKFSLIYVVFNTIFSLLTQKEQVRCFENVARHLASDGAFVVEAFVPDPCRYNKGQTVRLNTISENEVRIDVSELELDKQIVTSQHMVFTEQGNRFFPVKLRFVYPSEMDLMAQLAQLRLRERWSDWKKAKFTSDSGKHISVYEHAS